MITEVLLVVSVLLAFIYFRLTRDYDYWARRGVKHLKPSFLFGNFWELVVFTKSNAEVFQEVYNAGEGERYLGVIEGNMKPGLFLRDPELIKHVLGKDFSHFHDRGMPVDEKKNPLSAHLFSLEGARWRALRTKLTPTFTSGKMKNMLPLMQEVADEMLAVCDEYADHGDIAEMREIVLCFTTDVIGSCAFGVRCNSLRDPQAEFRKMGTMMFTPNKIGATLQLLAQISPLLQKLLPMPAAFRKMEQFFITAISNTVKSRETQSITRNDFLDLLIQIRKKGNIISNPEELKNDAFIKDMANKKIEDFEFTDSLMAAQAFVFFLAGFETSATTMSYALIELCQNRGIQKKLQEELDDYYKSNGNTFTYEALMKMPYLDKVIAETLRMYPPLPLLFRDVTQRYKVPDSDLVLEKGIKVFVPIHAIQHDPKYYPDPERFDPERFTDEAKQSRHHYVYLPFGEGPRNCIAQRFGLLQVKLGLAMLLQRYSFEMSSKMQYPPVVAKAAFFLTPDRGTYLHIKKRSTNCTSNL